uniref:Uncharacterized protein n=1 Tax=Romanomermis culicivorax TaxID=13658 RepID=A0A915IU47_ROMCU
MPLRKGSRNSHPSLPQDHKMVSAPVPTPALPLPPPNYAMPVTLHPSSMPKTTGDISIMVPY